MVFKEEIDELIRQLEYAVIHPHDVTYQILFKNSFKQLEELRDRIKWGG